jgi:hypothetical protein
MAAQIPSSWIVSDVGDYAHIDDLHALLTQRFSYEYEGEVIRGYYLEVSLKQKHIVDPQEADKFSDTFNRLS